MTKLKQVEIEAAMAEEFDMSKAEAKRIVAYFLGQITDTLVAKGEVNLPGFGKFSTVDRKARKGRNPQTGAEIDIPAKTAPKFAAGKKLKEKVNV